MQGPLREDFTRISTRSSAKNLCRIRQERLREEFRRMSAKARLPVYARIYKENATDLELENHSAQTLCQPAQLKGTSTIHRSHFTREFTGKMLRSKIAARSACEHAQSKRTLTSHKAFLRENLREKNGPQSRRGDFARDCAIEKHVHTDSAEEPVYAKHPRQYAGDQMEHCDQAPA